MLLLGLVEEMVYEFCFNIMIFLPFSFSFVFNVEIISAFRSSSHFCKSFSPIAREVCNININNIHV